MLKTKKQLDLLTKFILSEDAAEKAKLEKKLRGMLDKVEDSKATIQSVLRELGVPNMLTGYNYLVRAIEMQMQAKQPLKFTVEVYGGIAKEFGSTASRVERAMRHCVEVATSRTDVDVINRYFGGTINPNRGKPTLQHFICRVAEVVEDGE